MNSETLREKIRSYKYDNGSSSAAKSGMISKKPVRRSKRQSAVVSTPDSLPGLKDLPPSIPQKATVLFIGFNPGVESSKRQHHYAHPTNLFWKLFNASGVLESVLTVRDKREDRKSNLFKKIFPDGICRIKPAHDYELSALGIGFTDLCLRCTKQASELSIQEKLANVPRLFTEFIFSRAPFIVVVGKGIWEVIVKSIDPKHKLTSFTWGKQRSSIIILAIHALCKYEPSVYVFPNTSGLVALMKYAEKLQLWQNLAQDISGSKATVE
ncbi:DNA glycosylase [Metschnikowia bicuspidata]|uniref:DNA glycosylase n=1 Tax=Metschnikowia bicuspidata TaxID=27322 RepID=A0A4P9ZA74_9ASCO|nr:DNA glycosylase [Metschnikowia bicuspidata]